MKKASIFIVLIVLSNFVVAQRNKNFTGVMAGVSMPFNEYQYAEKFSGDGYAKMGFAGGLDLSVFFTPNIGIGGKFSYGINGINKSAMEKALETYVNTKTVSVITKPDEKIKYYLDNWTILSVMIGPELSLPIGRFSWDVRYLIGVANIYPPVAEAKLVYYNGTFKTQRENTNALSFGMSGGTSFRFALSDSYSLKLAADYTMCKSKITVTDTPNTNHPTTTTSEYKQNINNLQICFGIGYNF